MWKSSPHVLGVNVVTLHCLSAGNSKMDRDRESGYFSLGRAAGARTFREKSPPPPHRHSERGHPLPSNRTPEPKATIPFRNPDLGVPSHRRSTEVQMLDLEPPENYSPEPLDLSIEVEAQVGPRSPSPTPFKQAESLAASSRRGVRPSYSSSNQQSGMLFSARQGSSLSRSSSPPRNFSPFKRTESVSSLPSRGVGSGGGFGTSGGASFTQRHDQRSRSPTQGSYRCTSESTSQQKSFRTFANSMGTASSVTKSLSNSYVDLRAGLRKAETSTGHGGNSQSISPSRHRNNDFSGHSSLLRKTETNSSSNSHGHESRSSSPPRRCYEAGQSFLGKTFEGRRSASPVRTGYGVSSQSETSRLVNVRGGNSNSSSPSRRSLETISQSLRKSEINSSIRTHSQESRHSSPPRRGYETPGSSERHKPELNRMSYSRRHDSRSPSPARRSYETPSHSLLRKSETSSYSRSGWDSPSKLSSPYKARHESASQPILHKAKAEMPSYSRKPANSSTESWRGSTHSLHSPPISRSSSPSKKNGENRPVTHSQKPAHVAWESTNAVSSHSRRSQGARSPSPDSRRSSSRNRSPSPPMQRHTSSQSSMDSSESGQLSAGSSGLNREEYAIMADLPKVKTVLQREGLKQQGRQREEATFYKPAR